MRFTLTLILCVFVGFFSLSAQATLQPTEPSDKIAAVYGANYQQQNPGIYAKLQDLLQHRLEYLHHPIEADEKFPKLSELSLRNKNNRSLTRDREFNQLTFNPLKYGIELFPKTKKVYRFDNEPYLIVILPVE